MGNQWAIPFSCWNTKSDGWPFQDPVIMKSAWAIFKWPHSQIRSNLIGLSAIFSLSQSGLIIKNWQTPLKQNNWGSLLLTVVQDFMRNQFSFFSRSNEGKSMSTWIWKLNTEYLSSAMSIPLYRIPVSVDLLPCCFAATRRISLSVTVYEIYESLRLGIIRKRESGVKNRKRSKKRQQNTGKSFCNVFPSISGHWKKVKSGFRTALPCPLKAGSRNMMGAEHTLPWTWLTRVPVY